VGEESGEGVSGEVVGSAVLAGDVRAIGFVGIAPCWSGGDDKESALKAMSAQLVFLHRSALYVWQVQPISTVYRIIKTHGARRFIRQAQPSRPHI